VGNQTLGDLAVSTLKGIVIFNLIFLALSGLFRALTERLNVAILPYHLDAVSQIAGSTALDFEPEMRARVARLVEQRGVIEAGLNDLGIEYWPSQSNFVLFRPTGVDLDGNAIWQRLVDQGVLVRNCASWPRLDGCLRVTVGSDDENAAFLAALGAILKP